MTALLEVSNLSVEIAQKNRLSSVSFSVKAGEILSIIGPNGAGKTTLLRAISGDIKNTSDACNIHLCGKPLNLWTLTEQAQTMAVLTQSNTLSFSFTVAEVVALGRTPHNTGFQKDQALCREAMQTLDILHLAERAYPLLSGGEQQRVQLARVMVQIWESSSKSQRLLLLDEPATSLDLGHQSQLMSMVRQFAQSGVAVLMVVHDITLAAAYSDYLLALKNGYVVAQGDPSEVVTEALIGKLFDTQVRVIPHPETGKPVVLAANT